MLFSFFLSFFVPHHHSNIQIIQKTPPLLTKTYSMTRKEQEEENIILPAPPSGQN